MAEIDASKLDKNLCDERWMQEALDLARQGQGCVEPNPMVGCVIVKDQQKIGQGYHLVYGGDHAEISALRSCRENPRGSTVYVTLEPCCHHGKTPPCTDALIAAEVDRVVIAQDDPNPDVNGNGISRLLQAGIQVTGGVLKSQAVALTAPYRKRIETGLPWIIGKWAMTLDGKIATASGDSQWISNEASREIVHQLRGRVDAIMVGSRTAQSDDPLLTARPPGRRLATRIVLDSDLKTSPQSKLVSTAREFPTLLATTNSAKPSRVSQLESAGCEIVRLTADDSTGRLIQLLRLLGDRKVTNVLVEGGGKLLGSLFDLRQIDEIHVFIGPKMLGGQQALTPIGGEGVARIDQGLQIQFPHVQFLEGDIYVQGMVQK